MSERIVVVGATGFVGRAVVEALEARKHEVVAVRAPRLRASERNAQALLERAGSEASVVEMTDAIRGVDAVVNAAGDPDASSLDEDGLVGANGLLPAVVAAAADRAGIERLVHISSAVVQNDAAVLDESEELRPFSPYSRSKVLGEEVLRERVASSTGIVRYRPPSVHAPGRRVTRLVARVARSSLATVARPGAQPTPQALLPNVADAVAFLATCPLHPPSVVVHPSEGVTCEGLMSALSGGREPRRVPRSMGRLLVFLAKRAGRWHRATAANARRVELLWFGQEQGESWLEAAGWQAPIGAEGWLALGELSVSESP